MNIHSEMYDNDFRVFFTRFYVTPRTLLQVTGFEAEKSSDGKFGLTSHQIFWFNVSFFIGLQRAKVT